MARQIVMDRTGDTRHNFDAKNADALLRAEERFRELTGAGFTAAVRTARPDDANGQRTRLLVSKPIRDFGVSYVAGTPRC